MACMEIEKGGALTSWGTAFGFANIDLHPGDYCCNLKVLKVLRARRSVTWDLPPEPTQASHSDRTSQHTSNTTSNSM